MCTPRNVAHISGNIDPDNITLINANETKVKFLYSGSVPLKHPRKLFLCSQMEKAAKEMRKYLPVFLGMGVQCFLPEIEDEELEVYDGMLKFEADEREGMDGISEIK